MKTKLVIIMMLVISIILVACSNNSENTDVSEDEIQILKANLEVPETADVNEEVGLVATVSFDGNNVSDADKVVYEIWEEGQKDTSYKIESINNEDGTYTATTSFDKDGIFHVQVHVTAKDQHTMPQATITVGKGGHYENADDEADEGHEGQEDTGEDDHSDH
jgi:hypothetical protein